MGIRGVASPFLPFSASCRGPNETSLGPGSALGEKEEKNRRRRKKKSANEVSLGRGKGGGRPFPSQLMARLASLADIFPI